MPMNPTATASEADDVAWHAALERDNGEEAPRLIAAAQVKALAALAAAVDRLAVAVEDQHT